jgi:predicted amidophosphoribosyltransferase
MRPTKTHGICGNCREANQYTETNCVRCGDRLAWAFLIDGKDDKDFEAPIQKALEHFFHLDRKTPKYNIRCRFCDQPINYDDEICPHCGKWLASANIAMYYDELVDPQAPEIQRLYKLYKLKQENENRWKRSDD